MALQPRTALPPAAGALREPSGPGGLSSCWEDVDTRTGLSGWRTLGRRFTMQGAGGDPTDRPLAQLGVGAGYRYL